MNSGTIFIAGIGLISVGYLTALAVGSSFIDDDYLCICDSATGGHDGAGATMVPITNPNGGTCPHPNRFNNLFCN
ncbi:MAG: hypothetical protein QNJ91_03820 [Gammaproteobacteria bacterium]|nr:hypothetical protein [Gammaproteobacteria bacterium]